MGELKGEGWVPSPVRRVLLEPASFNYAFGNTRHTSIFRDTQGATQRVLLLGFGDIRNALATAAHAAALPATACTSLHLHLNDISLSNVARGVLLTHLVDTLDPDNPDDLHFLWGVWYCLKLPTAWRARLDSVAAQLSSGEAAEEWLGRWLPRRADAAQVLQVLRRWTSGTGGPSVPELEAARREHVRTCLARRLEEPNLSDAQLDEALKAYTVPLTSAVVPFHHPAYDSICSSAAVQDDVACFLKSGTIYPPGVSASSGSSVSSGAGEGGWEVNPTLLEPSSGAWTVHYGASPFHSYLPLEATGASGGGSNSTTALMRPRGLTQACLRALAALVRGWQACRAQRELHVQFWLGDALQLCQYDLAAESYSAVDTSNLADHVGLLNLLACVPRVLQRSPLARLYCGSMLWPTAAQRLSGYLDAALGIDPHLFPTVFGLRLMNDTQQWGREQPMGLLQGVGNADCLDVLEWMPAPCDLHTLRPSLKGEPTGNELFAALHALCQRCCPEVSVRPQASSNEGRCGLQLPTALTLLCLLGELAHRVEGVLLSGVTGPARWRQLAQHTAELCGVPQAHRVMWDALCCWASCATPGAEQPLVATAELDVSPAFEKICAMGATPLLQVDLFGGVNIPQQSIAAMLKTAASAPEQLMRPLSVAGYDYHTHRLWLLLPPKEPGEPLGSLLVRVSDSVCGLPLNMLPRPLGLCELLRCTAPPPASLRCLAAGSGNTPAGSGLVAAAAGVHGGTAAVGSQAAKFSEGVSVQRVTEKADSWEVVLGFDPCLGQLSSSGLRVEFKGTSSGEGPAHTVEIQFQSPPASAELTFGWPLDSQGYHLKVVRSKRQLQASLCKSTLWPQDRVWLPQVDLEALPPWPSGADSVGPLSMHLASMFSLPEQETKAGRGSRAMQEKHPLFDMKESLQAIFVRHLKGSRVHLLYGGAYSEREQEPAVTMVSHTLYKLPDGRPLLHISYVDHARADGMLATPSQRQAGFRRFSQTLSFAQQAAGNSGHKNSVTCTAEEVQALLVLFARNAAQLRVPGWQQRLLDLPSEWQASFLLPLYSDYVVRVKGAEGFVRLAGREFSAAAATLSSSSHPGSGGAAQRQPHDTWAIQRKERGNALFKQGRYREAAREYAAGAVACEAQVEGGGAGIAGRGQGGSGVSGLMLDLYNNKAMAFLKLAEAAGTSQEDARDARRQAVKACTAALRLDPGNAKALYRRAQAQLLLGRPQLAKTDLSQLSGSSDAAVERLRHQVAQALRLA